jgi:hypothetical protein
MNKFATGRAEIVAIALAMTIGKLDLIEGARKITEKRFSVEDPNDEVFFPIRAVESDTDRFPIGSAQDAWDTESLKHINDELSLYMKDARSDILEACNRIISKYSD